MCLLAVCETNTIPEENFREAFKKNSDGFGFAFRNKDNVSYIKGMMTPDEAWKVYKEFANKPIFPHVIHFRLGKPTLDLLTHPFEVTENSELNTSNTVKHDLLFHNGVISCWKDRMWEMFSLIGKIPEGQIMDTRVAAILLKIYGKRIFEFIDGKFVIFGPKELDVIGSFETVNGIRYSNDSYKVFKYVGTRNTWSYRNSFNWERDEIDEFIV